MNRVMQFLVVAMAISTEVVHSDVWRGRPWESRPGWHQRPSQTRRNSKGHDLDQSGARFANRDDDLMAAMSGQEAFGSLDPAGDAVVDLSIDAEMIFDNGQQRAEVLDSSAIQFGGQKVTHPKVNHHSKPKDSDDDVIRPTTTYDDMSIWTPVINESECRYIGSFQFCENISNYPSEAVEEILSRVNPSAVKAFFASDDIPTPTQETILPGTETLSPTQQQTVLSTRFKPAVASSPASDASSSETELCASRREFIFPQAAKNNKNEVIYVVNQENSSQPITIETCRKENEPCSFSESFPAGYKAICKQKFVTHYLAALKNGKIVREAFTVPSCCVCVVKSASNVLFERTVPDTVSSRMVQPSPSDATPSRAGNGARRTGFKH